MTYCPHKQKHECRFIIDGVCWTLPGFVESREDVALDDLVADVAEVAEQLVVVGLAVGQALALVVAVAQEGFLALGADEVLDVPVLAWKANKPMNRCAGQSQERLKQLDQLGGGSANQIHHPSGLYKL